MNEKLNFEDCFCIFSASLSFKVEDLAKVKNREGESVQLPFRRSAVRLFFSVHLRRSMLQGFAVACEFVAVD